MNKILHCKKIKLFIDSTFIFNKYGQENIGVNPEYKKKCN